MYSPESAQSELGIPAKNSQPCSAAPAVPAEGTHSYWLLGLSFSTGDEVVAGMGQWEAGSSLERLVSEDLGGKFKYWGANPALSRWTTGYFYVANTFPVT